MLVKESEQLTVLISSVFQSKRALPRARGKALYSSAAFPADRECQRLLPRDAEGPRHGSDIP